MVGGCGLVVASGPSWRNADGIPRASALSRAISYRLLLSICLAVLVSFTLPGPWNRLSAIGYQLLGLVMLLTFAPVRARPGEGPWPGLFFRIVGGAALITGMFWYVTPVGMRGSGLPVLALWGLFSVWSAIRLIEALSQERQVNFDVLRGALAGYLMLGLSAGLVFSVLETIEPGSFSSDILGTPEMAPNGPVWGLNFVRLNYFAFVCLTTTGFGDLYPVSALAQILSVTVAMAGTLYLAVVLGVLISRLTQADRRHDG